MRLTAPDRHLIDQQLETIQGWLMPEAAYLTMALLNLQQQDGVEAPLFEVGVYQGKYLALLYHAAMARGERVVGVDIFEVCAAATVSGNLRRLFGEPRLLALHKRDSKELGPADVLELLGGKTPRFISVDGDHHAPGVQHDMAIATTILHEQGILAIDDFLNPRAIGVSEGAYRHFLDGRPRHHVPFAYCANKLFVCHENAWRHYHDACLKFADHHPDLAMSKTFRDLRRQGLQWVVQPLLGRDCVIF